MILVVGATGMVGMEVCRRLAKEGDDVRALVRPTADPTKVLELRRLGIQTVIGDLRDRPSLASACAGVDSVISTASSMPFAFEADENDVQITDLRGQIDLIDAARAVAVRRFVYVSLSGNMDLDYPLRDAKRSVETHLRLSGVPYTILRPSFFMEVWLSAAVGFDAMNARATIFGVGTRPISWISAADVARFAVRALDVETARNATIELGGQDAIAPLDVVQIFERVGGRRFEVQYVDVDALLARQAAAVDDMNRSFAGLMRCYAAGDEIRMDETERAFGIEPMRVGEFAEATLGKVPAGIG